LGSLSFGKVFKLVYFYYKEKMVRKIIAVDLGGTNIRVSLVQGSRIIKYVKEDTPKERNEIIKRLVYIIESLMSKDVEGIGVGCPGPLEKGVIKNTPNLNLRNFDLKGFLRRKFKVKVEVENDANCVAIAESFYGCKKKNFIILTLGTGIGGGIIVDNYLYVGGGYGGELGHIILDNKKSFEKLWQSYRRECKKCFGRYLMIKELLAMKNRKSERILEKTSEILGIGIASLINIFDPEVVILSGGMKETGSRFLSRIKDYAKKYILIPRKPDIRWTGLDHPGTLGAALLIQNDKKSSCSC
jgi:glucokinase